MTWQNTYKDAGDGRTKRGAWHFKFTATKWAKWRWAEPETGTIWEGMELLKAAGWRCHIETYEVTGSQWLLAWPPGEKLHAISEEELDRRFYAELRKIVTPHWFELHGASLRFP